MALVMPSAEVSKLEQLKAVRAEQTSLLSDILSEALCAMKKQNSESPITQSAKPLRNGKAVFTNNNSTPESVPKIKPKPVSQKKKSKSQNSESMLKSVLTKQENRKRKRETRSRECNNAPLHHDVPTSDASGDDLETTVEIKKVVKKVAAAPSEPKAADTVGSRGKYKKSKTKKSHKNCKRGGIKINKTMGSEVVLVLNEDESELESGLEVECPVEWSVGTPRTVTTFLRRSFCKSCAAKSRPDS